MNVSNRVRQRNPIPEKTLVLTSIPFDVLVDCPSRLLVPVDVGGDDEFEIKSVERHGEQGVGSFAGVPPAPESLLEKNTKVRRSVFPVRLQSRRSGDDVRTVFSLVRSDHVLRPLNVVP